MKRAFIGILCCGIWLFSPVTTASVPVQNNSSVEQNDGNLLNELSTAIQFDNTTGGKNENNHHDGDMTFHTNVPVHGNEANPAISIILDFAGAWFGRDAHFRQGGHAPNHTGPVIQGAELGLSTSIDPWFELEVAFGIFHLHLEEIYMRTSGLPWNLQLRAGKYKSKIGRHNPVHLHSWNFVNQPMANEWIFGAEGLSLPGMELSWLLPLPWYMELIGSAQYGSAGSFRSKAISEGEPDFGDFIYPIRLVQSFDFSEDILFLLGFNTVVGTGSEGPETGNRTYAYGIDAVLKWRPTGEGSSGYSSLQWETELWLRQMEVPNAVWNDVGGYSSFTAGISQNWEAGFRIELWRQLSDDDENNLLLQRSKSGTDTFKISTALSYEPSHFSRIRLQHNLESVTGYPAVHSLFLQLEVAGGAHKAHSF